MGFACRIRLPERQSERRFDERAEVPGRDVLADPRQRLGQLGALAGERQREDGELRLRHQLARFVFLQHGKARGHIGLEGEGLQQARAKPVDRVDAKAAWRLDGAREETTRLAEPFRRRRLTRNLEDRRTQRRIVKADPARELGEHPVRHLGRGRLGEGEAQDAAGIDAGQQQPQDAVAQHRRLAGPGIGRDPGTHVGVGRVELPGPGVEIGLKSAHSTSVSSTPSSAHSAKRARWS